MCSWDSDWRMLRHSWAEVASDSSSWQPGSLSERWMLVRTRLRLKLSFPVPSFSTSRPTLAFSRASLVSLMAAAKRTAVSDDGQQVRNSHWCLSLTCVESGPSVDPEILLQVFILSTFTYSSMRWKPSRNIFLGKLYCINSSDVIDYSVGIGILFFILWGSAAQLKYGSWSLLHIL